MFVSNSVMQWYESINSYLLDKCIALSNTGGGTFIRESTWEFPVIEGVHVLSIAMSVGMILWFDLRLLGACMRKRPVSEVFRGVYWWMVGGFTAAVISGLLLFWAEADRAYPNIFARIKLLGLVIAGLNILYFHNWTQRTQREWDNDPVPPLRVRMAGFLSITCWVVVVAAGRLMAYTF
jgi:uncharacterized protein DUF6644